MHIIQVTICAYQLCYGPKRASEAISGYLIQKKSLGRGRDMSPDPLATSYVPPQISSVFCCLCCHITVQTVLQGARFTHDFLYTCPPTGAQPESYTVPTGHCAAAAVSL